MGDPNELLGAIEDYVARAVAPLQKRIQQLETARERLPERGEKGEAGERGADAEVDYDRIGNVIAVAVEKEIAKRPAAVNGKDGRDAQPIDYAHVSELVKAAAITAVAELPKAKDGERGPAGKDADVAPMLERIDQRFDTLLVDFKEKIAALPIPKDGLPGNDGAPGPKGADADISPAVHALEMRFVALKGALENEIKALPVPQGDRGPAGKDADEDAVISRVLAALPVPKDGVNGLNGKDADEDAIAARVLAQIPAPKDGRDGVDGKDANEDSVVTRVLAAIPKPKDGIDGKDGRDGQRGPPGEGLQGEPGRDALDGLSSIEAELRDERTLALDFLMIGGARKSFEFRLPIPIYRGLHKDGAQHEQGDAVTRDGSTWIAIKDTATTPPSADWTLAVKKGRDLR